MHRCEAQGIDSMEFAMQLGKTLFFAYSATLQSVSGGEASGLRSWPIKDTVATAGRRGTPFYFPVWQLDLLHLICRNYILPGPG